MQAGERFREATQMAPDFVLAYAKWAEALLSLYRHNALSAAEAFPVAQDAIAQALRRDAGSGEAYAALADLYAEKDRDWTRADRRSSGRSRCSPSSEYARIRFAMMLAGRGRTGEAVSQTLEAQSLNPRSSLLRGYAGAALHYAGRYAEAARMYEGTLQLDSQYTAAWIGLCKAYTALGRFEQAIDACEQVREDRGRRAAVRRVADGAGLRRRRTPARGAPPSRPAAEGLYKAAPSGDLAFWIALAYASLARSRRKRFAGSTWRSSGVRRACCTRASMPASIRSGPIRATREREARMDSATGRE